MSQTTGESQWQPDAQHARQFVEAMWDTQRGCYLAGTTEPETRNQIAGQLPLDVQAWSVLALKDALTIHPQTLKCAELNHRATRDGFFGSQATALLQINDDDFQQGVANPIDEARFFVRQHYVDFLNREPDPPGWDFWTDNITKCHDPARRPPVQTLMECVHRQRVTTSSGSSLRAGRRPTKQ